MSKAVKFFYDLEQNASGFVSIPYLLGICDMCAVFQVFDECYTNIGTFFNLLKDMIVELAETVLLVVYAH